MIRCPDAEVLAAWLDQGLAGPERARITSHLADCDECSALVAHVLEFQDADPEAQKHPSGDGIPKPRPVARPVKPVWLTWGGGVLAAAAALLLVVQTRPEVADRFWMSGADARLADLAQAASGQRTIEGRLTGGFTHGPLRAPVRSGGSTALRDNWSLLAAAGRIREEADKSPVAANLHGLGLAHLLLGEHDQAIRALEDATSEEPANGRFLSDLAAAYLARAQAGDRPDDLTRGLGAADRALKADHELLEARFNRALALERLYLTDQARKAWSEYLQYDSGSPWADEVRQHLQRLPAPDIPADRDRAGNNSPPGVTGTTIEAALDWVLRVGLFEWADAVLASDLPRAAARHSALLAYSSSIADASHDPFAREAIRSVSPHPALAAGVRRLALGLRALAEDDFEAAERELTFACTVLAEPLQTLCRVDHGNITALRPQNAGDDEALTRALSMAEARGLTYLRGRITRLQGWRLLTKGQTVPAMAPYLRAYELFEQGGYLVQAGLVASQVADLLDLQGLTQRAWDWRLTSLKLADATRNANLAFTTRVSGADRSLRHGQLEAALSFADAVGLPDPATLPPLKRVWRERHRLGALLALGDAEAAGTTLDTIDRVLTESNDFRADLMRPDVLLLRANVALARGDDGAAASALDEALSAMTPSRVSQRISALLARSRVKTRRSQSPDAEADVKEALELLIGRTPSSSAQALRLYDAKSALDAVAALVLARPDLQNVRGLTLLEQLREVLDGTAFDRRLASAAAIEHSLARLAPTQSLVYYLFADDGQLVAWVGSSSGILSFVRLSATAPAVARLVNQLTVQVTHAPGHEAGWRASLAALHRLLIEPLPELTPDLIVVPDGILNRVPFGALIDAGNDQFLFERRTVRLAPNLAVAVAPAPVADASSPAGARSAVVIGEPALTGRAARAFERLPGAKAEARMVAALYAAPTLLVGADATREHVVQAMSDADVLHFAGHALTVGDGREGARLLLAGAIDDPATALRVGDFSQQSPRFPERVVLAACGTAAASIDRSSGVASLAATFLRAGSRSVVGTLWPVEDGASEEFFVALHRRLTFGDSMAAALAQAQRACRKSATCRQSVTTWVGTAVYGSS